MRKVYLTVEAYKYTEHGERLSKEVDYKITLYQNYANVEIFTPRMFKENWDRIPSKTRIKRDDFVYWILSLNKTERKFLSAKLGNFTIGDFIAIVSYIFDEFYEKLKALEKAYAEETFGIYERMSLTDLENLVVLDKIDVEIKSWKDLMLREKPRMFHPHSIFYNPFFYHYENKDVNKTKLVESATEDIEMFLNFLFETNPEIIKNCIELVKIDEDASWQFGYIHLHPKLRKCIKDAYWSREVCLISASDTVRSWLKYDKDCIMRLSEELNKVKA
jgi:hypothetical protein